MRALVKTEPGVGHVQLLDVPEPTVTPNGVKIEVVYTGICGTDIHVYHDTFRNYPPVILGHEFSGVVTEVGELVTRVKVGDRVTVLPSSAVVCGTCDTCRRGYYMFCSIRRGMGHGVNGSFTKYVMVRDDMVYPLADNVSFEEAALTEPFAAAVQGIEELVKPGVGDVVLLSGPGPIGLLCLTLLLARNCKVIVAGTTADNVRLAKAKELGADVVVDVLKEDLAAIVAKETHGKGVDVAVEASGAGASAAACLRALKPLGRYLQIGIMGKEITLDFDVFLYKQIKMFGSVAHTLETWERVMKILEQRKIDLTPLITHKFPLSQWREAFDLCENKQGIKVLISYDE